MQPQITIITICYNAATTISRTLRSVTAQTYPHIQYLVIDGASKDNTLELVRDLAPQAEVYSEPDKGIYDAMNKGLDRATGDYVWYVNAGDALASPTTVEELVRATCSGSSLPDVLYGDTRLIDAQDQDLGLRRLRPPHELNWKSFRSGMLVCHQAFVAKRSIAPHYDLRYLLSSAHRALSQRRDDDSEPSCLTHRALPRDAPSLWSRDDHLTASALPGR